MKIAAALLVLALFGCSEAESAADVGTLSVSPKLTVAPVMKTSMCPTRGSLGDDLDRMSVKAATFRAVVKGSTGDAASLKFTYNGPSDEVKRLASDQLRRQIGLKLRAENGCNLVYVMWRIEPKPGIEVSVKRNPGRRTNEECGTEGYTKVKARRSVPVPALEPGTTHTLRAEIIGEELIAWVDGSAVWRGRLGRTVRRLQGPAGMRSDNVAFDIVDFSAPAERVSRWGKYSAKATVAECPKHSD